ncbi:hypothetical protein ABEB36_005149 [Hypothenemus hampei]|uniref:CHK kinase-like domain-containing protein n=1 Tax=Hypothenemus hampei TaxID=57062 RepID=A0ABD1EX57_HYPHA
MSLPTIDYSIKDIENLVAQTIDGNIKNIEMTRLTAPGENYLSIVLKVDFLVEKNGKFSTINAVAKRLPMGNVANEFHKFAMRSEILWYSELLPVLIEFGNEFGIDTSYFPKYLGSRLGNGKDEEPILLLQNLIPEGYRNVDRLVGFDLETTKAILRSLAAFHALPIIMKFKKPESFKIVKDFLDKNSPIALKPPPPPVENEKPIIDQAMQIMFDKIFAIPSCQKYRLNIEKVSKNIPMRFVSSGTEPWKTIGHSDFWINNLMIKSENVKDPMVKIVDFQLSNYTSYASDVIFFLLTSVRDDVQRQSLDELFKYYYDQLTTITSKANVPELKLSYSTYLEEIKTLAPSEKIRHALFFCNTIFEKKGNVPDVLTGEGNMDQHMKYMVEHMNERQKEKMSLIIELSVEKGWI